MASFHYIPLDQSKFYRKKSGKVSLPITEDLSSKIIRLPIFASLNEISQHNVINSIKNWSKMYV